MKEVRALAVHLIPQLLVVLGYLVLVYLGKDLPHVIEYIGQEKALKKGQIALMFPLFEYSFPEGQYRENSRERDNTV